MTDPPVSYKLFLFDGIGAIVSALLLGIVLVQFNRYIGMPSNVLYMLASVAVVLSMYSITCYIKRVKNWKTCLKGISILNLLYCMLTAMMVYYNWDQIKTLGVTYFTIEIILIIGIAVFELRIAS
ncbi:MAG: hypothetical protein HKN68_00095 [Saprospiraceae bacterium]|nr:hypothetical protein [Saprospiraceae bacterium]